MVTNDTCDQIKCNGYLKGESGFDGPIIPVVSDVTCVEVQGKDFFLFMMHQDFYYDDEEQDKSLCLPYQAMDHGVTFDITPFDKLDSNDTKGKQRIIVNEREVPLIFDGRKMFLSYCTTRSEERRAIG